MQAEQNIETLEYIGLPWKTVIQMYNSYNTNV